RVENAVQAQIRRQLILAIGPDEPHLPVFGLKKDFELKRGCLSDALDRAVGHGPRLQGRKTWIGEHQVAVLRREILFREELKGGAVREIPNAPCGYLPNPNVLARIDQVVPVAICVEEQALTP